MGFSKRVFLSLAFFIISVSVVHAEDEAEVPVGSVVEDSETKNRVGLFCTKWEKKTSVFGKEKDICVGYQVLKYHRALNKDFEYQPYSAVFSLKEGQAIVDQPLPKAKVNWFALGASKWWCTDVMSDQYGKVDGMCFFPLMILQATAVLFTWDLIKYPVKAAVNSVKVMKANHRNNVVSRQLYKLFYGNQNQTSVIKHKHFVRLEKFLASQVPPTENVVK